MNTAKNSPKNIELTLEQVMDNCFPKGDWRREECSKSINNIFKKYGLSVEVSQNGVVMGTIACPSSEEVMDKYFPKGDDRRGAALVVNAMAQIEIKKLKNEHKKKLKQAIKNEIEIISNVFVELCLALVIFLLVVLFVEQFF